MAADLCAPIPPVPGVLLMTKRIASLGEAVAGERLQLPSEATRIDNALSWELPSRTKSRDQRIML